MEKRDRCLPAHEIGHGHADAEGADDALDHDKASHAEAVVEADEAEENGCQKAVNGVGLEVIRCGQNDFGVPREDACQQVSVEKRGIEHDQSCQEREADADVQCTDRAILLSSADVLCDKS